MHLGQNQLYKDKYLSLSLWEFLKAKSSLLDFENVDNKVLLDMNMEIEEKK